MDDSLALLTGADLFAFGGFGLVIGVVLYIAARAALPRERRHRIRAPAIMLVAYALVTVASSWLAGYARALAYVRIVCVLLLLLALGRLVTVLLLDWFLGRRMRGGVPKIIHDIVEGLVVVAAVLLTLSRAGVDPTSILTTSALLTAIIGLSLQDTLGNLFAGLSLQAEQPFEIGDWIRYDEEPLHVGQVVEVNWRATKVMTLDRVQLVIPNGKLARSSVINFTKPTPVVRRSVHVVVPHRFPTHEVKRVLLDGLQNVPEVLQQPAPSVVTQTFEERGVQYWLRYFIGDFSHRELIDGAVRDRVWYALARAHIPIAAPSHHIQLREHTEQTDIAREQRELSERTAALRGLDFLRDLPDSALSEVAQDAAQTLYAPGELIVQQDEPGSALFICLRGEVSVMHRLPGSNESREIARLGAGGMFGELSLMTGEPRAATVRAITQCELLTVSNVAFARILQDSPGFAELISKRLAERQAALEALAAGQTETPRSSIEDHQGQLLTRIRRFFSI